MPVINIEDLTEKDKLKMEVDQLKKEVTLERMMVNCCPLLSFICKGNLHWYTRDVGLISGSGRSPAEGHGNPLQHSYLENPMDRGAWQAIVHGGHKELDTAGDLAHTHASPCQFSLGVLCQR